MARAAGDGGCELRNVTSSVAFADRMLKKISLHNSARFSVIEENLRASLELLSEIVEKTPHFVGDGGLAKLATLAQPTVTEPELRPAEVDL